MAKQRSAAEQQVDQLLQTARRSLRLSVAFLSRLDDSTQHLDLLGRLPLDRVLLELSEHDPVEDSTAA